MIFEKIYRQNRKEFWNVITHVIGLALAVASTIFLLLRCEEGSTDFKYVSVVIFGLSSLLVYVTSVVFHWHWNKSTKQVYRALDHISIYYLIAGSYTPFLLNSFPSEIGWRMFLIVWALAFIGTFYKFFFTGKHENFSLLFYVLMGMFGLIEYKIFLEVLSPETMTWIVAGGLLYLIGVIFFRAEKLKNNHAIWHVFVVMANIAHFAAVYTIL